MGSNLNRTELGVSNPLVTGKAAKIFFRRYMPAMPNIGLEETSGQPINSAFSIADHCFISSEIGGIFGRSRIVSGFRFAGLFCFAFFTFIRAYSGKHAFGTAGREQELRLGQGLHLL